MQLYILFCKAINVSVNEYIGYNDLCKHPLILFIFVGISKTHVEHMEYAFLYYFSIDIFLWDHVITFHLNKAFT